MKKNCEKITGYGISIIGVLTANGLAGNFNGLKIAIM